MHYSSSGVVVHPPGAKTDREVQTIAQAGLFFQKQQCQRMKI